MSVSRLFSEQEWYECRYFTSLRVLKIIGQDVGSLKPLVEVREFAREPARHKKREKATHSEHESLFDHTSNQNFITRQSDTQKSVQLPGSSHDPEHCPHVLAHGQYGMNITGSEPISS